MASLRNIIHLLGSVIPLSYLAFGKSFALYFTLVLLLSVGILEILRLTRLIEIRCLTKFLKTKELKGPSGSFYFLVGSFLTIVLYGEVSAILSLFVLSFSDPLAQIAGRITKEPRIFGKSVWGCLTFFLSTFLILKFGGISTLIAFITSIFSTVTEVLSKGIDDNLTIPVVTGFLLDVVFT